MISPFEKPADRVRYSQEREREAFPSQAADYVDFGRRIRLWEDREREFFGPVRFDHS